MKVVPSTEEEALQRAVNVMLHPQAESREKLLSCIPSYSICNIPCLTLSMVQSTTDMQTFLVADAADANNNPLFQPVVSPQCCDNPSIQHVSKNTV
jgi:hypothetical protein